MPLLQGKVALVTGGSRGIGAATARLLAARGATVAVNYLSSEDAVQRLVAEIKGQGGNAMAIRGDMREGAEVHRMVDEVVTAHGRLDIAVSNAAVGFPVKPLAAMEWDEFAGKLNGELRAAFELTRAIMPVMTRQKYGRIIYVASGLAKHPGPGFIAHGSAKAALVSFCKYVALELGQHGITANVVSPGLIETDATAHMPSQLRQQAAARSPMGRIGQPEDVAGAIAYYASDDSRYVTGSYHPVNGGASMD